MRKKEMSLANIKEEKVFQIARLNRTNKICIKNVNYQLIWFLFSNVTNNCSYSIHYNTYTFLLKLYYIKS